MTSTNKDIKESSKIKDSEKSKADKKVSDSIEVVKEDDGVSGKKTEKMKYTFAHRVLIRPIVTEKANDIVSLGKYVFEVGITANKVEVAKSIEDVYGIRPVNINIIKLKGKVIKRGKKQGRRKDWKKAIITLPKGKTITVNEGV